MKVFLRTPYNYDLEEVSNATGLSCNDPSKTVQDGKDDADINVIMERYARTGQFKPPAGMPQYGDFTSVSDFQSALNMVMAADKGFMELPARIRSRFHNNPADLLEFLAVDANRQEAIDLGILPKPIVHQLMVGDDIPTPPVPVNPV